MNIIDTNTASDAVASSRDLSFAVYVERNKKSAALIATFPATYRMLESPCVDYTNESYAFHMAHEFAASLECDQGERPIVVGSKNHHEFDARIIVLRDLLG